MASWRHQCLLGLGLYPMDSKEPLMLDGETPQLGPLLQETPDHGERATLFSLF